MEPHDKSPGPGTPSPMVPFFDVESGRVVQIPAAELRPGAVQARVQGIEGIVWLLPDAIEMGEPRHGALDERLRDEIRQIQRAFAEPRPLSFEEWEDGFRRDLHPDREIALWLHAARIYTAFAEDEDSPPRRDEIYRCVVGCLVSGPDAIWHVFKPELLGRAKAEEIVRCFFGKYS